MIAEPVVATRARRGADGREDLFVILATDGLWAYVSSQAAVERVWACLDKWRDDARRAEYASKTLIKFAMRFWRQQSAHGAEYCDDISVTVVCLPGFDKAAASAAEPACE